MARAGNLFVEESPARPSHQVREGERIRLVVPQIQPSELVPEGIPLNALYEDDAILVLDKQAGMAVHPGAGRRSGTLVHALLARGRMWSTIGGEERPGIVHRLDRNTSGVMVVARTDSAHRALSAQFKDRTVEKIYIAIVWGRVQSDVFAVDAPLGRDRVHRKRISSRTSSPRSASTEFRIMERLGGFTFLEARPRTGRTHQIRAHLKGEGHPILGDLEYGGARWTNLSDGPLRQGIQIFDRLALHARSLTFMHPSNGQRLTFEAPIPVEFQRVLDLLRAHGGDS